MLRYEVGTTGSPTLDLTLTHASFDRPCCFAFSPAGEMFVMSNNAGISRFLDPQGTPVFNGTFASDGVNSFHWGSFRGEELFISNRGKSNVSRFILDVMGNVVPNGAITAGLNSQVRAVQVNPATGELFVTLVGGINEIKRYLIDASGDAVPNGSITGGGMSGPHDMAFSPWGELFVANGRGNSVSRFVFDTAGDASSSGLITGNSLNGPLGLDFSPWGELFVGNSAFGSQGISRWVFDASFNATFNGSFPTPEGVSDLQFAPPSEIQVEIDIKPGSDSEPNGINVKGNGFVPVAILTTSVADGDSADFDATLVNALTVQFGPNAATKTHASQPLGHFEDVDGDGDLDLLLHFTTEETGIACGDTEATLRGETLDGVSVVGTDAIKTVACR